MAILVRCPSRDCGKSFSLNDKLAGKKVRCTECNTVILVPAAETTQARTPAPQQGVSPPMHHPARLVCTNCGAILGVRDAICSRCGGDVRSGVTVMRTTKVEKQKAGLFRWTKQEGPSPAALAAIAGLLLFVIVGLAFAAF